MIPFQNPLPDVECYNLTYQRSILSHLSFEASYVGNVGRQLPYNQELNAAAPGTGTAGLRLYNVGRTASTTVRADGVNSNYNSLQVNLSQRFSHGLTFTLAYAYSKSLDLGSNQASFTDNLNFERQYGPSDFDETHLLTISHTYDLPFGKGEPFLNSGFWSRIVGNWQLNGIFRYATGTPFTASADATACNCPGNGNFADAVAPVETLGGIGPGQPWFTLSSFAVPGPSRFGNAGRRHHPRPQSHQLRFLTL